MHDDRNELENLVDGDVSHLVLPTREDVRVEKAVHVQGLWEGDLALDLVGVLAVLSVDVEPLEVEADDDGQHLHGELLGERLLLVAVGAVALRLELLGVGEARQAILERGGGARLQDGEVEGDVEERVELGGYFVAGVTREIGAEQPREDLMGDAFTIQAVGHHQPLVDL